MLLNDIKKIMIERGMKGYDFLFLFGLIGLLFIYFLTGSFLTALTFAVFVWIISLVNFFCYCFNFGDNSYEKIKIIDNPKGNFFSNFLIYTSIILLGWLGSFLGAACAYLILKNLHINSAIYGLMIGIGAFLGVYIILKIYLKFILKKL